MKPFLGSMLKTIFDMKCISNKVYLLQLENLSFVDISPNRFESLTLNNSLTFCWTDGRMTTHSILSMLTLTLYFQPWTPAYILSLNSL